LIQTKKKLSIQLQIGADISGAVTGIKKVNKEIGDLARGSLIEAQATVKRLKGELASLDATALKSKTGKFLASELRLATAEMKVLEKQAGFTGAATSNAFTKGFSAVRQLAYVLPGVGIAGILGAISTGLTDVVTGLINIGNNTSSIKRLSEVMDEAKGKFADASATVAQLRVDIDLAKNGFLDKDAVVKTYNETIGKTTGLVNSLDEAEAGLNKNADAYIQFTLKKAIATIAFAKASEAAFEKLRLAQKGPKTDLLTSIFGGLTGVNPAAAAALQRLGKQTELTTAINDFNKIAQEAEEAAARIAKAFGFNFLGDNKAVKPVPLKDLRLHAGNITVEGKDGKPLKEAVETAINNSIKGEGRGERAGNIELNIGVDGSGLQARLQKELDRIGAVLREGFKDILGGIGEDLGNLLSGKGFGQEIFQVMGSLISQIGKALISYGIVKSELDKILGAGGLAIPGGVAIAAGVLAIAAGQLIKNSQVKARAVGGPVDRNSPYLVGERGPELFVPSNSGKIIPNNSLGSIQGSAMQMVKVFVEGTIDGRNLRLVQVRQQGWEGRNV
jgi:hypothetical protein